MRRPGLAIVNMLIYVVIFSILSGIVLGLLSSSTRVLEKNIRRTKGIYAAEAATVFAMDQLRQANSVPTSPISIAPVSVVWNYDLNGVSLGSKTVMLTSGSGPSLGGPAGTMRIDATTDYTVNW